jgi:hypothetical protein
MDTPGLPQCKTEMAELVKTDNDMVESVPGISESKPFIDPDLLPCLLQDTYCKPECTANTDDGMKSGTKNSADSLEEEHHSSSH